MPKKKRIIRNLPAVIPPPEPDPQPTDRFGRPTDFKPEYVEMARVLCDDGATDNELAEEFGCSVRTIQRWRRRHPEFAAVCKIGKAIADDRVDRTAYELATGYTITVTELFKLKDAQGNEVIGERQVERHIPPDPNMVRWWQKNRRGDQWKDKTEHSVTGAIVHLTPEQARERLAAKLADIKQRQLGTDEQPSS